MWSMFFADGGWGMYPTSIFGVLLVASAFLFLFRPERRFARIVFCGGIATFGSGLLGTSVGFVTTFRYLRKVPPSDQLITAALGCAESLNNLVLALILTVIAALVSWAGLVRAARRPEEPV
jgi:hypothetical protein